MRDIISSRISDAKLVSDQRGSEREDLWQLSIRKPKIANKGKFVCPYPLAGQVNRLPVDSNFLEVSIQSMKVVRGTTID